MKRYLSILFPLLAASALAQFNATITVTDLGSGAPVQNANVQLNGNSQSTDALGQTVFTGLPDDTYAYSVSAVCHTPGSGSVTIAGGDADAGLALEAQVTNNLFFYIGSPFALIGATVQITDGADYDHSFVTWDTWGGEMVENVPFGVYSYTITKPCYETVTGTVTVDCNNGDGIAVVAEPAESTTNNLFFFIGSPFALIGATVHITDGADYDHSFVTWDTWGGEMVENVPFGVYSYTISKPCYETVTGTVTVDCNNGDGIAVVAEPMEIVLNATVTLDGSVLTAVATGLEYQWVDCDNGNAPIDGAIGQSFAPTMNGNYAVIITSGDCSQTSSCTAVDVTGTEEIEARGALVVYQDPFGDALTVRIGTQAGTVRVELFNSAGRIVLEETRAAMDLITLQTAHLPSGSYLLRLTTDRSGTARKVVIARQ